MLSPAKHTMEYNFPTPVPTTRSPIITEIWAELHTLNDFRGRGGRINEMYRVDDAQVIARNRDWGNSLMFRRGAIGVGQIFDVSRARITLAGADRIRYLFEVESDEPWEVDVWIRGRSESSRIYDLGRRMFSISSGTLKWGLLTLRCPEQFGLKV